MSLSALIKKGGLRGVATATPATSATDKAHTAPSVATVATVAVAIEPDNSANDPPHSQDFDREAFEERAAIMEHDGGLSCADAEALAADLCGKPPDPDRYCWPFSVAMNTAEIDTFTRRVGMFAGHGLDYPEAEALADRLVIRDREADGRRLCLECEGLDARGRCLPARRGAIPGAGRVLEPVTTMLQRCEGFTS